MKIIILKGESNSGKTITLNIVCQMLLSEKNYISQGKRDSDINQNEPYDFREIFQSNEKRVVLYSMGDLEEELLDEIEEQSNQKTDIFICACNDDIYNSIIEKTKTNATFDYTIIQKRKAHPSTLSWQTNILDAIKVSQEINRSTMNIIMLTGDKNCGKTTTISIAYNKLLSLGGFLIGKHIQAGDPQNPLLNDPGNDFHALVSYKDKRIFFHSCGDESKWIENGYSLAQDAYADILITACNNSCYDNIMSKIKSPLIVKKMIETEEKHRWEANIKDVDEIISFIN